MVTNNVYEGETQSSSRTIAVNEDYMKLEHSHTFEC